MLHLFPVPSHPLSDKRGARTRSAMAKQHAKGFALTVNFLLNCSQNELDNTGQP
jgi:hypothetical protein